MYYFTIIYYYSIYYYANLLNVVYDVLFRKADLLCAAILF